MSRVEGATRFGRTFIIGCVGLALALPLAHWAKGRGYVTHAGRFATRHLGRIEPYRITAPALPGRADDANAAVRFERVRLTASVEAGYTAVRVGPDHCLYAATDDGRLFRYPIFPDGTLAPPRLIDSIRRAAGGPRVVTGFCFDPESTPDAPVLWVAHNAGVLAGAPEWSGTISRLSGADLGTVEDAVVGLPRSIRDHMTNQPAFGPDGALYFAQGSNTAYGAPDRDWGGRAERLMTASVLRLDVSHITPGCPLDARTIDVGGTYDPAAPDAPLTVYATGVRNAFALAWHSNGHLYVPVNGSSPGGNAPAGGGAPALEDLRISEDDVLLDVRPSAYYGHPNPAQGHFVLHGGNPNRPDAPGRIAQYPSGVLPDPSWAPPAFNFGQHASANGIIEYRGGACGGRLDHALLVCRFNLGSDVLALDVAPDGTVHPAANRIAGLGGFACPLDLAEDLRTGFLYVAEYGGRRITLARPRAS